MESNYKDLIRRIVSTGKHRTTRNGETLSTFGEVLVVDSLLYGAFPLITSRRMYHAGIIGEFAAFLAGPKHIDDFKTRGCNYWDKWADEDGGLRLDYGNLWRDFEGVDQLKELVHKIKTDPTDRRLLLSAWHPGHLYKLSLPCCHYMYQFYVNDGRLDMMWHQRSADVMIGIPSDIALAAMMVITIANECNLKPGLIKMVFGDTHVYKAHLDKVDTYVDGYEHDLPTYTCKASVFKFRPSDFTLHNYRHEAAIKYELL